MDDSSASSNLATAGKPSQTIYVNNLNEKIKLPKLKQTLASTFRPLGNVLEVIALSNVPPPPPPPSQPARPVEFDCFAITHVCTLLEVML